MCINYGYFYPIVGGDFFIVSLDDIAISVFYLLLLFVTILYTSQLVDEILSSRGLVRYLSLLTLVVAIFVPNLYSAFNYHKAADWAGFYSAISFMLLSALAILAFLFVRRVLSQLQNGLSTNTALGSVLFPAIVCVAYGFHSFLSDLKSARIVQVEYESGTSTAMFITERSEIVVLMDKQTCEYSFLRKSGLRRLTFQKQPTSPLLVIVNKCLPAPFWTKS
jgi:hypothetical protein